MLNRSASLAIQQAFSNVDGMSASSDLEGKLIKFTSKVVAVELTLFFTK